MNKKIVQKIKDVSIVTRIILLFLIISIATYTVNLFMYWNINKSLKTIEYVYVSNAKLNDLTNNLDKVQSYMHEYLNTSSSNALASYYTNFQDYSNLVNDLNDDITDNESILMERKIRNMSLEYLEIADITIQAKRGRNIERYKKHFAEASELYEFINANIYSLNNQQFKHNSDNYYALLEALKYLEAINMIILMVIGIISLLLIVIITNSITEPLKKLASQANEVATGNFDVTFDDSFANDEVGVVSKAFKKMVINIQKYIKQIKESIEHEAKLKENELLMKNLLKDAQLKYLQAQINPHFL
ncbi:MAG TPA: HAMP domain-containing protein, partial [Clostridiales bacterium]|nr:HAMP domain-containing protein [Clostridiales bacterium]